MATIYAPGYSQPGLVCAHSLCWLQSSAHLAGRLGTCRAKSGGRGRGAKPMPRDLEALTFTDLSCPRAKRRRHRSVLTARVEGRLAQELNLGKGPFFGFLGSLYRYAGVS